LAKPWNPDIHSLCMKNVEDSMQIVFMSTSYFWLMLETILGSPMSRETQLEGCEVMNPLQIA